MPASKLDLPGENIADCSRLVRCASFAGYPWCSNGIIDDVLVRFGDANLGYLLSRQQLRVFIGSSLFPDSVDVYTYHYKQVTR